jgi:DNA polymerase III epsilon subunit-like protein
MKILIIDIETTGFLPTGKIVEVGLVELDLTTGGKRVLFDKVINPNLPKDELDKAWIVTQGYMTSEEILNGILFEDVKDEIQDIVNQYPEGVTAYNRNFDCDFLDIYGISFPKLLKCPMKASTNICKIPFKNGKGGNKWPNVEEAYNFFFPNNDYTELHRGADDAYHEADIVLVLHRLGKFLD